MMQSYGLQDYWYPGDAPTPDEGYETVRFKGLTGSEHEMFLLQDPEIMEYVADIFQNNVNRQRDGLAMEIGPCLSPKEVLRAAEKNACGGKAVAVVDGCKIMRIKPSEMAEVVAYATITLNPEWALAGLGLSRNELCLYLARECDKAEERKLKQKAKEKAETGKSKDESHSGGRSHHGGRRNHHSGGGHNEPPRNGRHGDGPQHPKRRPGGRGAGKGFDKPRAKPTNRASIAETVRTVNAGHWRRSKGPWAFGGVRGANDSTGGDPPGARGGHGARGGTPKHEAGMAPGHGGRRGPGGRREPGGRRKPGGGRDFGGGGDGGRW